MSDKVLSKEQVRQLRVDHGIEGGGTGGGIFDSHEALRAARDAALAEVERMRPCAEACEDVFVSYPDGHLLPDPGFKCWKAGKAFRASAQKEATSPDTAAGSDERRSR